jgi:hypothetical protein
MNTRTLPLAGALGFALLLSTAALEAAPKKRRLPAKASADKTEAPAAETSQSPVQKLRPYIENIEPLLALQRPPGDAAEMDRAQGRLAVLRQEFTAAAKGDDPAAKAQGTAALQTCQLLENALDERSKTLNALKASQSVKSSDDLGERRKDTVVPDGLGRGRAKGARVEAKRERREELESREEARDREDAMTARSVQRWNERAVELRKQITASYARIPTDPVAR